MLWHASKMEEFVKYSRHTKIFRCVTVSFLLIHSVFFSVFVSFLFVLLVFFFVYCFMFIENAVHGWYSRRLYQSCISKWHISVGKVRLFTNNFKLFLIFSNEVRLYALPLVLSLSLFSLLKKVHFMQIDLLQRYNSCTNIHALYFAFGTIFFFSLDFLPLWFDTMKIYS